MDLLCEKVLEGSSVPGQDQCLGSIAPGRSPTQTSTPTGGQHFNLCSLSTDYCTIDTYVM